LPRRGEPREGEPREGERGRRPREGEPREGERGAKAPGGRGFRRAETGRGSRPLRPTVIPLVLTESMKLAKAANLGSRPGAPVDRPIARGPMRAFCADQHTPSVELER
jgi:hypothetical protein